MRNNVLLYHFCGFFNIKKFSSYNQIFCILWMCPEMKNLMFLSLLLFLWLWFKQWLIYENLCRKKQISKNLQTSSSSITIQVHLPQGEGSQGLCFGLHLWELNLLADLPTQLTSQNWSFRQSESLIHSTQPSMESCKGISPCSHLQQLNK